MPDNDIVQQAEELTNSLGSLCASLTGANLFEGGGAQISQTDTLFYNNRWSLISNLRQLLSQIYVEHGIVQTLIDQPVDDAFRSGFELKTGKLDADDIEQLMIYCGRNEVIDHAMQARKWARLYGGGGVMIITDQDPLTPLNVKAINPKTPLEFRSVDMWELYYDQQNAVGNLEVGGDLGANRTQFYDYYGHKVHETRVFKMLGKKPPSFIKPRLRGWAMSELERLVRSLNQYMKNQDVIFELLDEAKIDVYKMKGFNSALMSRDGTDRVARRIQHANAIKNFQSALTMDAEDAWEQKQINFSGLAEILIQIRQGIAADLKMPVTKIFGISAAGFNSGEDDIENYNSMIEGEIRRPMTYQMVDIMQIACQKVFGFMVDDLQLVWSPLRQLNAKEEEEVKDSQFNRTMSAYQSGLIEAREAKESINKDSLLPVEIDETSEAAEPLGGDYTTKGGGGGGAGKDDPKTL